MKHSAHSRGGESTATDPVCGMKVDPATTKHRHTHEADAYVFCSAGCRGKFVADAERYLGKQTAKPTPPTPEGTIYTCPMHPEIRQTGPGACPICGMAPMHRNVAAKKLEALAQGAALARSKFG